MFTLCGAARYEATWSCSPPSHSLQHPPSPLRRPVQRVAAERQAMAVVRILPGAQMRFSEIENSAPERFRDTQIRGADGWPEPARLIEFQ